MPTQLKREIGVFGAVMMGLGSIIGTGVFVSIGLAADITGPAVLLAVAIGALVAIFNGLNSAQLAANHPTSGGTYEYGYHYLNPQLGFTAGWMFLLAKSASAATAALGFAGYTITTFSLDPSLLIPLALGAVITLTSILLGGIRRSNQVNIVIVSITLFALATLIITGLPNAFENTEANFMPFFKGDTPTDAISNVLHASALMFVAYTGYGRIATLGEEVKRPQETIPRAVITALAVTMTLYIFVAFVSVGSIGSSALGIAIEEGAAPLEAVARSTSVTATRQIIAIGAITAMLGVLLNLILGLSRVLLAMGRRGDMPSATARINATGTTPYVSIVAVSVLIIALVLTGSIRATWSFSAFTVLIYYAITNLAALRIKPEERRFPRWLAFAGLFSCLFLAFWVEVTIWLIGLGLIALGLGWQQAFRRLVPKAE